VNERITRAGGRVLDESLTVAIRRAAGPTDLRFTERQLYYELCRVFQPFHRAPAAVPFTAQPAVPYPLFAAALRRRAQVPGLLPAVDGAPRRQGWLGAESDILDYGLPRLLICSDAGIARMLVANDLHMEATCAVFAEAELPLDPRLPQALGRFPGAAVYVLHDASVAGLSLPGRIRDALALPAGVPVSPLGLLPRHAGALHLTSRRDAGRRGGGASPGGALPAALTGREVRWLRSGRYAETAAVPPAQLVRTLHRLLRGGRRPRDRRMGFRAAREVGFLSWPAS
jgi:hypothetical protein